MAGTCLPSRICRNCQHGFFPFDLEDINCPLCREAIFEVEDPIYRICIRCNSRYYLIMHTSYDLDLCYRCDEQDAEEEYLEDPLDYANSDELWEWEEAAEEYNEDGDEDGGPGKPILV